MLPFLYHSLVATAGCSSVINLHLSLPLNKTNLVNVKQYVKCLASSNDKSLDNYLTLIKLALTPAAGKLYSHDKIIIFSL